MSDGLGQRHRHNVWNFFTNTGGMPMLISFNDLFSANADGTVTPVAHIEINGKTVAEGTNLNPHEVHIGGLNLIHLRGQVLEGERKDDRIIIKSYVRSLS